jgi:hypothetical protein
VLGAVEVFAVTATQRLFSFLLVDTTRKVGRFPLVQFPIPAREQGRRGATAN